MTAHNDLICLVADKNTEKTLEALLGRPESLKIRPIEFDIYVHPEKDPGCRLRSGEFLRPFSKEYAHALVLFDREGSGADSSSRTTLEKDVEEGLARLGWQQRSAVVVIDPELEAWVWSDSPEVGQALGWTGSSTELRSWLEKQGFSFSDGSKPIRPKEAVEAVLREARKPRSSAIYRRLASKVSFQRCEDPAFSKLKKVLRDWFPAT